MAISEDQLQALENTIASGVTEVRDGRRQVTYRSLDELQEIQRQARADVAAAAGQTKVRRLRIAMGR